MFRCNLGGGGGGGRGRGQLRDGLLVKHAYTVYELKCKLVSVEKGSNGNSTMGTQSIRTWAAEPRQ